jgi:hypothetical protein
MGKIINYNPNMKKILILALLATLTFSCSTQRFSVNPSVKREEPSKNPHFTQWSHFFVWGIGQTDFTNAAQMCKDNGGVDFVETKLTFAQGLIGGITYGIYSPRNISVYCNKN